MRNNLLPDLQGFEKPWRSWIGLEVEWTLILLEWPFTLFLRIKANSKWS